MHFKGGGGSGGGGVSGESDMEERQGGGGGWEPRRDITDGAKYHLINIGIDTNATLAYDLGMKHHQQIVLRLRGYRGRFERYRERDGCPTMF